MKCSKARILISAELDGELSPSEELALTGHLAKCSACAQEKASLSSLRGTMALWADEEPSEWLAQSFSYKLKDLVSDCPSPAPKAVPRRRWGIYGSATAGLVTAGLLLVMLVHNQPQQPIAPNATNNPSVATGDQPEISKANEVPVATTVQPKADPGAKAETVAPPAPRKQPAGARTGHYRRYTAAGSRTQHSTETTVVLKPQPAPAPAPAPETAPSFGTDHAISLPARGGDLSSLQPKAAIAEITVVEAAKPSPEQSVGDNIGEAGLAMNENVEKIRGTLQEALDLLISKPPVPIETSTETDGGSRP